MYLEHFGLREKPFSLTPDPRYAFHTERYRAALDHLRFGIQEKEGFMLLTGGAGTGKTTLCRALLEGLEPERYRTALLFNPFLSGVEMLQALLSELGCTYPREATQKELLDRVNRFLLARLVEGCTCIAIFDEAQHLSTQALEQIRVLSNLETATEKLIQIILVGQPELRERIEQPGLAQLDQRVSLRCTLAPLTPVEMERLIYHRLNVAGAGGTVAISSGAIQRIHRESGGVPRRVNQLCERSLLAAYVDGAQRVGKRHVDKALRSLRGEEPDGEDGWRRWGERTWRRWVPVALSAASLAALLASAAAYWFLREVP